MNHEVIQYVLLILITLAIAIIVSFILRKILNVFVAQYAQRLNADPTNFSFIKNSIGFIIYAIATIFIFLKIPYLKSLGTALFAGAGIVAVIVGFASQKAFANIISGIFILIFKPYRISDIIEFKDGSMGVVEDIPLRHTLINNYENRRIVIPNSVISEETIINSNIQDEKIRKHIVFSISYDSSIDKAMDIIRSEAENHPLFLDNRNEQEIEANDAAVAIRVVALSDYSVDLKAYIWTAGSDNAFVLMCDLLKSVKERFDKEGIEIPFPYRTIVYKKDLKPDAPENK